MKSKSFELKGTPVEKGKHNKTFDFVGLYKTSAETNVKLKVNQNSGENAIENGPKTKSDNSKRERSPNKKKKNKNESVDISQIDIDARNLNQSTGRSSPVNVTRLTSTPNAGGKSVKVPKVKSIMKTSSVDVEEMEESYFDPASFKSKKRNKSVSFMLEDSEEVAVKKTKSSETSQIDKKKSDKVKQRHNKDEKKEKFTKLKNNVLAEKENQEFNNMETENVKTVRHDKQTKGKLDKTNMILTNDPTATGSSEGDQISQEKKRKAKKIKKNKKVEAGAEQTEDDGNTDDLNMEIKSKKIKKKKRKAKSVPAADGDSEGEPATKSRKMDMKPDTIAENLEHLSIGDNAHTLTNLIDEMTVVDKDKKKKQKQQRRKDKVHATASASNTETGDLEKIEEGKEKIKWKKRKWNKDRKGDVNQDKTLTSVIIENLPIKIMTIYKKLLSEHFGKLGLIRGIGIAEVYPTEDPKPVFTTTIDFDSAAAATKALEDDNTPFEGSRIRVKRPLPATATTLVVRSYAELTEQGLSSVFTAAGRIRGMRHLVKGKKSMATSFIEFDGPATVERAIKMAEEAKIGGKKIYVSKYEQRAPRVKKPVPKANESENEGDSEVSND